MKNTPKYKVGDEVRLHPFNHFDEHISIPASYWHDKTGCFLTISKIKATEDFLEINGVMSTGVYYNFGNSGFTWAEEYIIEPPVLLPEDLFDI